MFSMLHLHKLGHAPSVFQTEFCPEALILVFVEENLIRLPYSAQCDSVLCTIVHVHEP